jgi:hypothetical protein
MFFSSAQSATFFFVSDLLQSSNRSVDAKIRLKASTPTAPVLVKWVQRGR